MAGEHVDMRRHVDQVAGIGHQRAQGVGGLQRPFRERRHLHQVDIEVEDARVAHGGGVERQRLLQHGLGLLGGGALRRSAGLQVPHLPRRAVQKRLGEDGAHVEAPAVCAESAAHGVRESVVPRRHVVDRLGLGVTRRQRAGSAPPPSRSRPRRAQAPPAPRQSPWRAPRRGSYRRRGATACCSSAPRHSPRPNAPWRSPGPPRAPAGSRPPPPRGYSRRSR